jgi:hypothetical protein
MSGPSVSSPAAPADASASTSLPADPTGATPTGTTPTGTTPTASDGLLSGRQLPLPSLKRTGTGTGAAVRAMVADETFCWLPTTWQPSRLGDRVAGATFANSGARTTRRARELVLAADQSTRSAIAKQLARTCADDARKSADSPVVSVKVRTLTPAEGYAGFTVEDFEDADAYAAAVVWSTQTGVLVILDVWLGNDDRSVRGLPAGSALADAALTALRQAAGR